jgi:N,N-dimethylformamidase
MGPRTGGREAFQLEEHFVFIPANVTRCSMVIMIIMILDWFDVIGKDFDVITDEDLYEEGYDLLKSYKVVLAGTHPQYHTVNTLDALQSYVDAGGHFLYLGGDGFYWRIAASPVFPGLLEIRRGEGGVRPWASMPGEYYNNLDGGSYGGLWRRNDRPPQ